MTRFSLNRKIFRLSFTMLIASLFFLTSVVIELSEYVTGTRIDAGGPTIPAFILIMIVFTMEPSFAYSTPVSMYRMLVIHETGPLLAEIKFDETHEKSSTLLASVTSVLDNIMNELMKNPGTVKSIKMTSCELMIESAPNIFVILETDRSSRMLRTALKSYASGFSRMLEQNLKEFRGEVSQFSDHEILLNRYFPFL